MAIDVYFCECLPGSADFDCSADLDECLSGPCQNGATCIESATDAALNNKTAFKDGSNLIRKHSNRSAVPLNEYRCLCVEGWEGENCAKDVDECLSSPCRNGAKCTDLTGTYATYACGSPIDLRMWLIGSVDNLPAGFRKSLLADTLTTFGLTPYRLKLLEVAGGSVVAKFQLLPLVPWLEADPVRFLML